VPTSNNSDEDIARFRSLALQAKAEGDMVKAKEYLVQMKVRLFCLLEFSILIIAL